AYVNQNGQDAANVAGPRRDRAEALAQIENPSGEIVRSSSLIKGTPLLPAGTIRQITSPTLFDRRIPGIDDVTRVFAVPVSSPSGPAVVILGSSLQDRRDELLQLAATLAVAEPIALLLISLAGWFLAGAALRPVERMRREAAALSLSEPGRGLAGPPTGDGLAGLAALLNVLSERVEAGLE